MRFIRVVPFSFCCAILTFLIHAVVAAPIPQNSSPGLLKRKTYAVLQKANEGMANANIKKHKRLLGKKEYFRKQALMEEGVKNFLRNTKKSNKAGERAEGEHEKAKRRTQRAEHYERKQSGVEVRWLGILAVALWHHRVICLGAHCIFQTLPMNCVLIVSFSDPDRSMIKSLKHTLGIVERSSLIWSGCVLGNRAATEESRGVGETEAENILFLNSRYYNVYQYPLFPDELLTISCSIDRAIGSNWIQHKTDYSPTMCCLRPLLVLPLSDLRSFLEASTLRHSH